MKDSRNTSVTKLLMEGNRITLTEGDRLSLAGYSQLVELYLDANKVTRIPVAYFSVVPHLRVLSLSRNQIDNLEPEALSGLDALMAVNMSYNQLTSLPAQLLRGLNHLQVVDLQGNPWNCTCPLLTHIEELRASGVPIAGPNTKCASPEGQAGRDLFEAIARCFPTSPPSSTADATNTTGGFRQSPVRTTLPRMMQTSSQDDSVNDEQRPASGNTWKFAAWVAALALTTSMLIVCAIKGPSWYRLYHNYRHRQLRQEENDDGRTASSIYSETGRYVNQQTFTFDRHGAQEEDDAHYFEDPYIKTEE
ncbi:leucine-rich repeat-containing protein 19-like isoform X2 [Dunckerocampus dactyliophorus]|uniref:leucine-rich repeat-containing protein 19-like isoform X2 n=1 Tax=Dunckerocampus dactyliophorus TaxID=161453 RepID=UPI00240771C8|nr:leucine-rich repeat-containing protein 19-like isoform X2 [Dunckerocampus dactyliophorus]